MNLYSSFYVYAPKLIRKVSLSAGYSRMYVSNRLAYTSSWE